MELRPFAIKSTVSDFWQSKRPVSRVCCVRVHADLPCSYSGLCTCFASRGGRCLFLWLGSMLFNGSQIFSAAKRHESDETLSDVSYKFTSLIECDGSPATPLPQWLGKHGLCETFCNGSDFLTLRETEGKSSLIWAGPHD